MLSLPPALAAFNSHPKFIVYKLVPSTKRVGKTDKLPVDHATARCPVNAQDPAIWTDFQTAALAAELFGAAYGVGYVFTPADPFWFLDIDGARSPETGEPSPLALELATTLAGCAIEVSSSGTGYHIFGSGTLPEHGCVNPSLHLELYHEGRFVALGGREGVVGGAAYVPSAETLASVVARYFQPAASSELGDEWWTDQPVAAWRGPEDDVVLLERALRSASAASLLGGKARFVDLWDADISILRDTYPPNDSSEDFNRSVADAALAQHLAFWTGNNAQRICDLMFQSGLKREKWVDRWPYYMQTTIRQACAKQTEWLQDALPAPPPVVGVPSLTAASGVAPAGAQAIVGSTYLMPDEQIAYFDGCTYVQEQHRMLLPNGTLAKPDQFKAVYGGRTFVMDGANERTSRNAFEAFTESQAFTFPRADKTCFRPQKPFGTILVEGGMRLVNTYFPVDVPRAAGDPSKFLNHLKMLIPNEHDSAILLAYLAACVQHQGTKFQWAPFIQGVEGNGKTVLGKCVARAIGKRYVHWPLAKDIDNSFNAWLEGHTFYAVDETYISDKRIDVLETLKPMITGDEGLQITKKGVDSTTQDICGNFGFFSNYKEGIRKSRNDRRIAPFFTAQQSPEDLIRCGMGPSYFSDLVDWLKGINRYTGQPPGYDVVSEFLWTYAIPDELNPAGRDAVRAPITSSTAEAIAMGLGSLETAILEAIEQGEPKFRGGWISSTGVADIAARNGIRMNHNKFRSTMRSLGYDWHPALEQGRTQTIVLPDAQKPQLFVKADHPTINMRNVQDVAASYSAAQTTN